METLERWRRRRKTAQALALRARIALVADEGSSNAEVAEALGITRATVGKWRSRFLERRLDWLRDEPRPGAPRSITDEDVERVVTWTLKETRRRPRTGAPLHGQQERADPGCRQPDCADTVFTRQVFQSLGVRPPPRLEKLD